MSDEKATKKLYIIISQTGTVLSRILKAITGAEYNHASIGLEGDLQYMYSFGRKNPYNPFWAGFVTESPNFGTFKRFPDTMVKIISIEIPSDKHEAISERINYMLENKKQFGYNYWGLWLAWFKIVIKSKKRFYCSEFVKDILVSYNIEGAEKLGDIPQPVHFLNIPNIYLEYTGKLKDYSAEFNKVHI